MPEPYPCPDQPDAGFQPRLILEIYARELREHAAQILYDVPEEISDAYKRGCLEASRTLMKVSNEVRRFLHLETPHQHKPSLLKETAEVLLPMLAALELGRIVLTHFVR